MDSQVAPLSEGCSSGLFSFVRARAPNLCSPSVWRLSRVELRLTFRCPSEITNNLKEREAHQLSLCPQWIILICIVLLVLKYKLLKIFWPAFLVVLVRELVQITPFDISRSGVCFSYKNPLYQIRKEKRHWNWIQFREACLFNSNILIQLGKPFDKHKTIQNNPVLKVQVNIGKEMSFYIFSPSSLSVLAQYLYYFPYDSSMPWYYARC